MRILVFSDSHGAASLLEQMLFRHPDCGMAIHLGDGERDFEQAMMAHPALGRAQVAGNCDWGSMLAEAALVEEAGCRLLLCHGHRYNVKTGTDRLLAVAAENGARAALYGHTHCQRAEVKNGILLFNPGSVRDGRYGILTLQGGRITPELRELE